MEKKRDTRLLVRIGILIALLILLGWVLMGIFEGEKPQISLQPLPEYLSGSQKFTLSISDMKRGLRTLKVSVSQGGREIPVVEKEFPFVGLFNKEGSYHYAADFTIDPSQLNLAQGRVDLNVQVWDYSMRRGGDGNYSLLDHEMIVDTVPPAIRAVSHIHHVDTGGAGLVVYRASSDCVNSGLYVNDRFFQGFSPEGEEERREGFYVCYYAIPLVLESHPKIYLWAEDRAGNSSEAGLNCRIREKRYRKERINVTDRLLDRLLPYFSNYPFEPGDSQLEKFLKINRDLRQENTQFFYNLRTEASPARLWDGAWTRLKGSASMARFGDERTYYYEGKEIDKEVHLGTDLASLANSEVQAANRGRIIYSDRLGIYGLTVVIDHGQGLASVYSHLSETNVEKDQIVMKGDVIGLTGQTGLALGDHLHFGVMVGGIFVDPLEWWDPHWIQEHIYRNLDVLKK